MDDCLLRLQDITKNYPGVKALDSVSLSVERGTVHGIIGENGAGKSTLIKVISGAIQKDSGKIFFDGKEVQIANSRDAIDLGIGTVYQEMNLVPSLDAVDNIFLGEEKTKGIKIARQDMRHATEQALKKLDINISLTTPVKYLSTAQQQMVEIARSLVFQRKLIIMDEPTSSLAQKDVTELFRIIRRLKEQGVTIIFISHKLNELAEICDRVTVMRDGCYIDTVVPQETTVAYVVSLMVGRELDATQKVVPRKIDNAPVLEARNLCDRAGKVLNASFTLPQGIILGFAGLIGAGRTELMRLVFGADPIASGDLLVRGKPITKHSTEQAVKLGIAYLSEDRKNEGLLLKQSLTSNISLANLSRISKKWVMNLKREAAETEEMGEKMHVKTSSYRKLALFLSGGNQQKVALAKWLFSDCDILILDEPTRGIDVQARSEIYMLMNELVDQGKSIILVSSDLNEILSMSNVIVTMCDGRITGKMENREGLTQEELMASMLGGTI